jgi:hypothetical protein
MGQTVECSPSKHETLNSAPSTTKKKKKKKKAKKPHDLSFLKIALFYEY